MGGSNKSKLSKLDRDDFLRAHGFVPLRQGKGDHTVWEHPELRELAQKQKVECPGYLLNNVNQPPWQHTVPDDPGGKLWHRISSHAEWCQETVAAAKGADASAARHKQIKQDFLDAKKEICQWKHETKHRLRAGLDANPAPDSYHRIKELQAKL